MDEHKLGTLQSWGRLFTLPSDGWEAGRPGKLGCWEIGSLGGWEGGEARFPWKVKKVPKGQHGAC